MKTRRHHNNTALTSTKRGKRKAEAARLAEKYALKCLRCGLPLNPDPAEDFHPVHVKCPPKQDVILERPEEEPGYGHGV